jgi:hypothetical protein
MGPPFCYRQHQQIGSRSQTRVVSVACRDPDRRRCVGLPQKKVQSLLGHATMAMTARRIAEAIGYYFVEGGSCGVIG